MFQPLEPMYAYLMKRVLTGAFSILIAAIPSICSMQIPSYGMQGGIDATGDEKVVALTDSLSSQASCSGALISPRIVFTAGHCLEFHYSPLIPIPGDSIFDTRVAYHGIWVSEPGVEVALNSNAKKVEVMAAFRSPSYQSGTQTTGPKFDFAVLVLKEPIGSKTYSYATAEQLKSFVEKGKTAVAIGYGATSREEWIKSSQGLERDSFPHKQFVSIRKMLIPNTGIPTTIENSIVETLMPAGSYPCSGDSGGPLWVNEDQKWIYIGAISGAMGMACSYAPDDPAWKDLFWLENHGGLYWSAQAFLPVINDAEAFLKLQIAKEELDANMVAAKMIADAAANQQVQELFSRWQNILKVKGASLPSNVLTSINQEFVSVRQTLDIANLASLNAQIKSLERLKVSITCIKGKLTKKLTSINPKCPTGFKQK